MKKAIQLLFYLSVCTLPSVSFALALLCQISDPIVYGSPNLIGRVEGGATGPPLDVCVSHLFVLGNKDPISHQCDVCNVYNACDEYFELTTFYGTHQYYYSDQWSPCNSTGYDCVAYYVTVYARDGSECDESTIYCATGFDCQEIP